jgi:hypothetical protein
LEEVTGTRGDFRANEDIYKTPINAHSISEIYSYSVNDSRHVTIDDLAYFLAGVNSTM